MQDNEKIDEPIWFVMDGRAVHDTERAAILWSAGNRMPSRKELRRDWGGIGACLCIQREGKIQFMECIP